jgi:hypothetical protein
MSVKRKRARVNAIAFHPAYTPLVQRLRDGCGSCEFEEADGELIDHCEACCRAITGLAYDLFLRPPKESKNVPKKKGQG